MCWGLGASLFFGIFGLAMAFFLAIKKRDNFLWIPVIYFAIMELIQAASYLYIDSCTPTNEFLTFISFIHIVFQPFFINMLALAFIPTNVREKITPFVFAACLIITVLMLTKLYPFSWAGTCEIGKETFCGTNLCTTKGNFHLAWSIPMNGFGGVFIYAYVLGVFILPLIYGSWRAIAFLTITGPIVTQLLTSNINESPTIWCLFAISLMAIVLFTKLMEILKVKRWYFWNYPKL